MPFPEAAQSHHLVERIRRVRRNTAAAYGIAVALVAGATALRALVAPELIAGLPFITYYPAIIAATLVCGLWPGVLALVLSSAMAWYFFLPPMQSWLLEPQAAFSLLFFACLSLVNVALVRFLDRAMDQVIAREGNIRVLVEAAPNGIVVVDAAGRITLVNASAEKLFGYERAELIGRNVEVLVPHHRAGQHETARGAYQQAPETRPMGSGRDLSGRRKDGSEFPVEIGLNPLSRDGRKAVLATVVDITAHKRAQESQRLLVGELQHRTRNLFAVVQSIANQTLTGDRSVTEAKYVFNNRLQALARAHAIVAESTENGSASLSGILDRQFAGFAQRVTVSGCDIAVGPSAAQHFALIVHELTTNALKYGALSEPGGHVSVEGTISPSDGLFSFSWKEAGGPPVSPLTRKGFGTAILIDMARQLGRNVTMTHAPEGIFYELEFDIGVIDPSQRRVVPSRSQDHGASVA